MADELIEPYQQYDATIRLRRHMPIKPGMEALDGLRIRTRVAFRFDDEDSRYPGEFAMEVPREVDRLLWIASGDLTDIIPADLAEG